MQTVSRELSIEALSTLPLALDRLWPQIDPTTRAELRADLIARDHALLQRLPHQNVEPNSTENDLAELRAHLAEKLHALPEADWTHYFLIDEVWLSIEELLARHIAADCLAVRQLLEITTPPETEAATPKLLHARQLAGTNMFSRPRIQRAMPHHLRSTNVVIPTRRSSWWRRIFDFFFEALIEDIRKYGSKFPLVLAVLSFLAIGFTLVIPILQNVHEKDGPETLSRLICGSSAGAIVMTALILICQKRKR